METVLRLAAIGLFFALAGAHAADVDGNNAEAETLRQLLDEVKALRSRIQVLEGKLAASPSALDTPIESGKPAETVPTVAALNKEEHEMPPPDVDTMHDQHSFLTSPRLNFHGYADLGYHAVTSPAGTNSFTLGQADLFLTSKLSDKLSFLMETAIDSDANNVPGIEIERILLTYRENQYFNVDVGRYHSAIGYFNGAFHHGRWFQTAADRPFLFWFEDDGGLLPIHNVGLSLSGRVPSGPLNLHYVAEMGNGRAYKTPGSQTVQTVNDENNGKSVNFALYATPSYLPGWQLGTSVYRDRLTPDGLPKIEQRIYSAHAVYIRDRVEFLNEAVLMHHETLGGPQNRVTTVPAFYSQLAYRTSPGGRPYFRFEYMNPAASDPVVSPVMKSLGYRRSFTGGYRFDLTEFCAFKFQIERTERRDLRPALEGTAQLSFAF